MTLEMLIADQLEVRVKHIPARPHIQNTGGSFFCCCTLLFSSPLHKEGGIGLSVRPMLCLHLILSLLRVDLGGIRPWTLIHCNAFLFLGAERSMSFASIQADLLDFRESDLRSFSHFIGLRTDVAA